MVDTRDLKSRGSQGPCRFESGSRHQISVEIQLVVNLTDFIPDPKVLCVCLDCAHIVPKALRLPIRIDGNNLGRAILRLSIGPRSTGSLFKVLFAYDVVAVKYASGLMS